MSDIFWIAGASIWKSPAAVKAALEKAGVQPAWIEEAHWILERDNPDGNYIINGAPAVVFQWKNGSLLPDYLLHNACRSMELRERNLVLLVEEEGDGLQFAVLCSPRAIGMYNLMPHAHIAGWWAVPPSGAAALPQKLEKSGFDESCVTWLSGEMAVVQQAQALFPGAQLLDSSLASVAGRLNHLVHKLDEAKCSHGLLLGKANGGPLLATLVER